jgi:hypothetical protein
MKNWRNWLDRQLVPAKVLSLIRDGKVASRSELRSALGFDNLPPSIYPVEAFESRLWDILDDLAAAGLVSQEGAKLAPTELIAKVQKALHISLTELGKAYEQAEPGATFVEQSVIEQLRQSASKKHDFSKLVRFCEELNSSFASGNYLASTLLIRALLNHVPPIFGHTTFLQVVSQAGRSVKELLKPLEEISRDVADMHTHSLVRHKESLPTKSQVEPFKANLEVLLHEIIVKVQESG